MARLSVDKRVYDNADVVIAMLGDIPAGVTELEYSSETAHEKLYGIGDRKPIGYSMGQKDFSASMTLAMPEVIRIEDRIQGEKDLTRIEPFWLIVTYTNESYKVVVDKLFVKFQNQGRNVNGDTGLTRQLDLFVLDIQFNVV